MAKKGLFGRLAESVRNTVSRLFGGSKSHNETPVSTISPSAPEPPSAPSAPITPSVPSTTTIGLDDSDIEFWETVDTSDYQRQSSRAYRELEDFKSQYEDLIHEANQRWELIESQGYQSMAISRARDEMGRDYFFLDSALDKEDVIAEVTRARVFLSDKTSTLEGAELYTSEINSEQFRGKFGGQYRKPEFGNKGFDIHVIDEEYAKEVFRSYRMLEEEKQGLIQEFGSENLIIAMYDSRVRGNDPYLAGRHLIETWYKTKTQEWEDRFENARIKYSESNSYQHGTPFDYVGGEIDDRDDDMYF